MIVTYEGQQYEVAVPRWYLEDILIAEFGTMEDQANARAEMEAFDVETESIIRASIDAGWYWE